MARWNIRRALDVAALLRERWPARWISLSACLGVDDAELALWSSAANTIVYGFDPRTGLFEQFAGRSVPMDVILGHDRIQRSQVVKQADVVALLGLLPGEFPGAGGGGEFPSLRTSLQPWQFAQPGDARFSCSASWLDQHGP